LKHSNDGGAVWRGQRRATWTRRFEDYSEAIRLDVRYSDAYVDRGLVWFRKKEYDRAIVDETEAIRLDPQIAAVYTTHGTAWLCKKQYDKAIADYDEAIRIDPKNDVAYRNGDVWRRQVSGRQEGRRIRSQGM
jgi:tetratricopeptide (TPR) repeat protein